jgi:outer membrane protein assembly factor BamE (lipoprotein component of BamABCDE complex)
MAAGTVLTMLTGCGVSIQTTSAHSEMTEKRLTLGTVQREVRKGMSAAAVAEALGSPNIVTTDEERREVWIYDRIATERVQESGYATLVLVGYSRDAGAMSQRALTVIVKFDGEKRVRDYAYHASRF